MIKKFPTIISFYTCNTLYQLEIQNLIASCKRLRLKTDIEGVPSFGSWELNCAYKPFFILRKLKEIRAPVLWVDADGVFVRKPEILREFQADFAVRINRDVDENHPSRVASGTVYVNYTERGIKTVLLWAQECRRLVADPQRKEEFWDQIALRNILPKNEIYPNNLKNWEFGKEVPYNSCLERATIARGQGASEDKNCEVKPTLSKTNSSSCLGIESLPVAYVKIFDHPQDNLIEQNPVIVHYQASRRLKSCVKI
jgi:hypothetical protein